LETEIVHGFVKIKNSSKLQIINPGNMKANRTCVITSNWELGAGKIGSSDGPKRIKSILNSVNFSDQCVNHIDVNANFNAKHSSSTLTGQLSDFNSAKNIVDLIQHASALSSSVEDCIVEGQQPLVLSGDHSNAIGTVSGLCRALGGEHLGVVWIDAHLDLHSPYTTPSGNIHGMSVNALLEDDNLNAAVRSLDDDSKKNWELLKQLKNNKPYNCIKPEHLIFIGTRSYETQEWELIQRHNILVITVDEIKANGYDWLIEQIDNRLKNCLYRYVSFDVDSLDSSIATATGTPENHGLDLETASFLFEKLWNHPQTVSVEITEFNPSLPEPEKLDHALLSCFSAVVG